jgi:O-acetylhomoserine (thiol)-lyase
MAGFTTRAIHGRPAKKDPHGTLRAPVYDNVAFEFESSEQLQAAFEGRRPGHSYSRISNPTIEDYELRVRALADALAVVAVSSGMAAITNVILTLAEAGTNIVTTRSLFGNTFSLFTQTLGPWGLSMRPVDMTNPAAVAAAIDDRTRAVYFETITNPQLQVADAPAIAEIAHARGVPVVVDGTVTTPYLFKSKDFGVDVEVLSSTKYISGGATSMGGLIIDNGLFDWARSPKVAPWAKKAGQHALVAALRREVYRNFGACLTPHNAFLQSLGLETLALRVDRSCENALTLARWLATRPEVKRVGYPGLEGSASHEVARRVLRRGFGGILTFELDSRASCFRVMDALTLIRRATNVNDNKTLVIHPGTTIFCEYSQAEKDAMGVSDTLVRLSVGIEDVDDLRADLEQALERA